MLLFLPSRFISFFFCSITILLTTSSISFAGVSWFNQPAWASGSDRSAPEKKTFFKDSSTNPNLFPFSPGSNNLALDVGQVFLMGDLGKYTDSIGSQLHYTYGVSDLFGFDTSLGYSEHSDGNFSMLTFLTGLRTNLSWYDKVVPYVVFGLGFYKPTYSIAATETTQTSKLSPLLFGIHLGPGVDLELTRQLFFGASLTFHDVFGSTRVMASGATQEVGGSYTSFLLHAGVTF